MVHAFLHNICIFIYKTEGFYFLDATYLLMSEDRVEGLCEIDWRFAEFTSAPSHVLYSTCAEFLALPISGEELGQQLIDVIFHW